MLLTVFGATGGTGTQVVRQGLAAGHEVAAVVRDPSRLALPGQPGLRIVRADVMDPDAIVPAVEGAGAVVSALGTHGRGPTSVCTDGVRAILQAMGKADVRRLVVVSAAGAFSDQGDSTLARLVVKPLLQRVLREGFADIRRMEDAVRASDSDWTIMRPPRLTNGPRRGRYRTETARNAGAMISRADLADAILTAVSDPEATGRTLRVGY
jgi:putative NADH-flavin reductase